VCFKKKVYNLQTKKMPHSVVPAGTNRHTAMRLVYKGKYHKTRGGLTKANISKKRVGTAIVNGKRKTVFKYVSKKKVSQGKRLQREFPYRENSKFMRHKGKFASKKKSRRSRR